MITGNEMEVNRPVKVEDLCLKQSRHARRKRLEIKRLKSSFPSDDHDPDHVEDNRTSCGMGMMKRNMKMKLGFCGGINYNKVVPACEGNIIDQTTQTDHHDHDKRDGLRREMEDTVTIIPGLISSLKINRQFNHGYGFNLDDGVMEMKYDFYAVYDGHGGSGVANVCRDQLHRVLVNEIESCDGDEIDWENVMVSLHEDG
ncbi:protein phosphatase 2C 51-like [Papaver somniferum]|uniref:protein phosphatase 2C 51-like n=1 Tax=Papaver somniferum TaxID=3469 RepID=UPI000E701D71|nr:protein phosphatase 2C 51-like [Papaver somniferum]